MSQINPGVGSSGGGSSGNVSIIAPLGSTTASGSLPVTIASDNTGPVQIWDGASSANVLSPGIAISSGNALLTANTSLTVPFTTTTVQAVGATEIGNYRWVSIYIATQGTSSNITFQTSNDNVNWTAVNMSNVSTAANPTTNTGAANITYEGFAPGKYFRLNVTGISAGTTAGTMYFSSGAGGYRYVGAAQINTYTVGSNSTTGSAVPANAFYLGASSGGNLTGLTSGANTGDAQGPGSSLWTIGGALNYNGTNWDRQRSANTASNTTGTGLLGVGNLAYDGTNWQTLGAVAGDTGFNGLSTASATKTYSFTTSATGVQQLLANTPMSGYSKVTLIYTSVGGGLAATVQFSPNSGGTYMNVPSFVSRASSNATAGNSGVTNSIFYESPVIGEFLQLNITAMTSGTTSGYIILSNTPWTYPGTIGVGTYSVQSNSATGSGAPANAFMMGVNDGANLQYVTNLSNTGDNSTSTHSLPVGGALFNGTNWDRQRNNTTGAIIAAGATTTQTSATQTTYNASKLAVIINISAFTSGTLTFTVNGITSSNYTYPILVSTALGATGVTPLRIFPGSTPSANAVANDLVPRSFNVVVSGTFSATYGVDYELSV